MPRAAIGQGDTPSASDCRVAYDHLSSKYGSSNIAIKGFVTDTNTPQPPLAAQSNFAAAKAWDVLYWSSHGSSVPALNVVYGPEFESGMTAYDNWRSTSNALNVTIFAACYQFDGDANRGKWANNIMRKSDIRAMCGYHDLSPLDPADATIANKFFTYANTGSEGNSVVYSWKQANATTSGGSNYIILVYYGSSRQNYRLPGFPGPTYPAPDRDTTAIYRYTSANPNGAVVPRAASLKLPDSAPYTIDIVGEACRSFDVAALKPSFQVFTDSETKAAFYGVRENASLEVTSEKARKHNRDLLNELVPEDVRSSATTLEYDDAMAEVQQGEKPEGPESIIGATTQLFQHYNGIVLAENCIAAVSDANGVIGLSSQWLETAVRKNADHIDLAHRDLAAIRAELEGNRASEKPFGKLVKAEPTYVRSGNQYVLHYDIAYNDGYRKLVDAKALDQTW